MNQPDLGKKILQLRHQKGLTQGELAGRCNLSLRTVQRIESAEVFPRSHTIKVIFSSLDYDTNKLSNILSNDSSGSEFLIKTWMGQFLKFVFDVFNLKTNTMKKLSVLSLVVIIISVGLLLINKDLRAQNIEGWFLTGSEPGRYAIGLDGIVFKTGSKSAFLESTEKKIEGFGTIMQTCGADEYLGKTIKMTAYVKSENVSEWAGMWLRVDSKETKKTLSFDNMKDRPITGNNDWTMCEIILDVPEESGTLNFGVLLSGTGKLWFDNINFEVVDVIKTKATSEHLNSREPSNLDFGE